MFNSDPSLFCPQTNISSALTKIITALPRDPKRNTLLLCEDDFPTCGFVFQQAERLGFEVKFIPGGAATTDPNHWINAFSEDVALVHLTHVFSNAARRIPIDVIAREARKRGIQVIADVAQSAGVIPVHPLDWGVDYMVGTSVKYLCGGPGACFLWCHPDRLPQSRPLDVGWFSHEDPFAFDIHNFRYASDARRFWGGTPSVAPFM